MIPKPRTLVEDLEDRPSQCVSRKHDIPKKPYSPQPPGGTAIPGANRRISSRCILNLQPKGKNPGKNAKRCTKGNKPDTNRYAGALLKAIDGVDEVAKSCKVLSIEVHHKPRKMSKFRFLGFSRQGF